MHEPPLYSRSSRRDWFGFTGGSALLGALASLAWGARAGEAGEEDFSLANETRAAEAGDDDWVGGIDVHIHAEASRLPGIKPKPDEIERLYDDTTVEPMARRLQQEMDEAKLSHVLGMGTVEGSEDDPLGVASALSRWPISFLGLRAIGVADSLRRTIASST